MNKAIKYLFHYLKLPVAAFIVAGGVVFLADRYIDISPLEFSLVEKALIAAAIFCILLAIKNHFTQVRIMTLAREHLDGIAEFEQDIAKRLDGISIRGDNLQRQTAIHKRLDILEQKQETESAKSEPGAEFRPVNENIPQEYRINDPKIVSISSGTFKPPRIGLLNENNLNVNKSRNIKTKKRPYGDLEKHLDGGKLQMHLQPALTLPDRVITHYEAFARLELANDRIIKCRDFLAKAEKTGAITKIDNQMLFKIIQLLRQLRRNGLEPGIFWNLSHSSIANKKSFNELIEVLTANSVLCPQIMVEISQTTYLNLKQSQLRRLSSLREVGVRLSIDQCDDIALLRRLVQLDIFSFIKIPVETLIGYEGSKLELTGGRIAQQANENGIKLIATHVEEEFQVLELIDLDVSLGQGYLFSKPRPLKNQAKSLANNSSLVSR
ncbi:MAG: EAL domain-containing protein [Rhizobiaceae bacterium]|nr:EAL domain-containing protein [Rhizobiaceae bacterium]